MIQVNKSESSSYFLLAYNSKISVACKYVIFSISVYTAIISSSSICKSVTSSAVIRHNYKSSSPFSSFSSWICGASVSSSTSSSATATSSIFSIPTSSTTSSISSSISSSSSPRKRSVPSACSSSTSSSEIKSSKLSKCYTSSSISRSSITSIS